MTSTLLPANRSASFPAAAASTSTAFRRLTFCRSHSVAAPRTWAYLEHVLAEVSVPGQGRQDLILD